MFQGTHQLLVNSNSTSAQALNLEQTELIVKNGAVPQRVAAQLEEQGQPPSTGVEAESPIPTFARSTSRRTRPRRKERPLAADLYAQELNAELMAADQAVLDEALAAAQSQIDSTQAAIAADRPAARRARP